MIHPTNRLFQTRPLPAFVRRACVAAATSGLVAALVGPVLAQDKPPGRDGEVEGNVSLPRMPSISPDGQTVVFSYHGDLWSVPAAGGNAVRLTNHPALETSTRFSPAGDRIAFNSTRRGSTGIYTMNTDGTGIQEILATDRPALITDWTDGGDEADLLFTGYMEPDTYRSPRPFTIPADGGVYERMHDAFGRSAAREPGSDRYAFVRGGFSWERRHYRGADARDVWLYDADADEPFTQLTEWEGNDGRPRWAGEGKLVYTSDNNDNTVNLYLMDLADGEDAEQNARRLTDFDDRDVEDFDVTPDGETLVIARWDRLYTLDLTNENAQPEALAITAAEDEGERFDYINVNDRTSEAQLSPDGETMAFIAYGQLYIRPTDDTSPTQRISSSLARHRDIAWSPDGGTLYFVSDESGMEQVYAATVALTRGEIKDQIQAMDDEEDDKAEGAATQSATGPATTQATTRAATRRTDESGEEPDAETIAPDPGRWVDAISFHVEPVLDEEEGSRNPIPSPDATRLAYTRGVGDLIVLDLETGEKTPILDGWSSSLDYIWSTDSKHLAYSVDDADFNQDVWVTRADGSGYRGEGSPVNVTRHPDDDVNMSISADGRVLAFSSERVNEEYDVWRVYLDDELETLTPGEIDDYYKSLAEKVKKIKPPAVPEFAKNRGSVSPLVEGPEAPQTRPSEGQDEEATRPATRSAPAEGQDDRSASTIAQVRQALRDFILEAPDEPATREADGDEDEDAKPEQTGPKEPEPTLDDFALGTAYLRLDRQSSHTGNEYDLALLPNASAIYYNSGDTLYKKPWNGGASSAGSSVNLVGADPTGSKLVYRTGGGGGVQTLSNNSRETYSPDHRLEVDLAEQNERKFRELARTLGMMFYHPTMKDLDWDRLTDDYAPLARAARTDDEFEYVAEKLLGELNASHLGVNVPGSESGSGPTFGRLGVRTQAVENGFRVVEVLETGPAGRGPSRLMVDDIITAIDLREVDSQRPLELQLANQANREVVVTALRGGEEVNLLITPVSYGRISGLTYDAWRLDNLRKVEELSGGRLGYIHIQGMNQESLDVFERDLYAACEGKEGLVIDVRNNGGGWTTDRLLASIMYPRHAYTIPRGMRDSAESGRATSETGGYPQDRLFIQRYTLPINMLCNEKSFSNAEIISHAFKTLGRGTLVGQETAGGVISTGSFSLIDGTSVRLPFRGWYLPDGTDMENHGAVPDIIVEQTPQAEAAGEDEQLQAAVEDLLSRLPEREEDE